MRRLIGEMVDAKRRTSDEKWMPRVTMTMRVFSLNCLRRRFCLNDLRSAMF